MKERKDPPGAVVRKRTTVRYMCALCGGSTPESTIYTCGQWVCAACVSRIEDPKGLYHRLYTIFLDYKTRWNPLDPSPSHTEINDMATCLLKRASRTRNERKMIHLISITEPITAPFEEVTE